MLFLTFICFFSSPPQAPFTPFITEMMYQNLRHLIDPDSVEEKDASSIHYLMLPQVRWEKFMSSLCCWPTCNHFSPKYMSGCNPGHLLEAWRKSKIALSGLVKSSDHAVLLIALSDARYVRIYPQLMGQHP